MPSLFEHEPYDRRGLREARAESRNNRLVSHVSKYCSTSNAETSSGTKIGNDVRASITPVVLGKRNRTRTVLDIDVEKPMEPHSSSRKANQERKGQLPSKSPTEARQKRPMTKLTLTAVERNTPNDVRSKYDGAQLVHRTTLRSKLGVFDDPCVSVQRWTRVCEGCTLPLGSERRTRSERR